MRKRLNFTCKSLLHVAHRGVSENSLQSRDKREDVKSPTVAGILGGLWTAVALGRQRQRVLMGRGQALVVVDRQQKQKLDVLLIYSFILRWF